MHSLSLRLGAALLALLLAAPVAAETLQDQLTAQLRAQGYHSITASNTWLGRLRVMALIGNERREIVINPYTGEILRDYQGPVILTADEGTRGGARDGAVAAADATASTVTRDVQDIVKQEALGDTADPQAEAE